MITLTREQAIKEFRKMWEWIANQTLIRQKAVHKTEYFKENYLEPVHQDCYLCHYARDVQHEDISSDGSYCKYCPIDFNKFNEETDVPAVFCSNYQHSPYNLWIDHYTKAKMYESWYGNQDEIVLKEAKEAAHYAREVARLPERR